MPEGIAGRSGERAIGDRQEKEQVKPKEKMPKDPAQSTSRLAVALLIDHRRDRETNQDDEDG